MAWFILSQIPHSFSFLNSIPLPLDFVAAFDLQMREAQTEALLTLTRHPAIFTSARTNKALHEGPFVSPYSPACTPMS